MSATLSQGTLATYESEWSLFCDWCEAHDLESLPASPHTVYDFLTQVPGAARTRNRRVTVINRAHEEIGYLSPGRHDQIVDAVRAFHGRGPRSDALERFDAVEVRSAIADMPVRGWPGGIFGRRDAALIALVCAAGLSRRDVCTLMLGSARSVDGVVTLVTRRGPQQLPRADDARHCPACAFTRWQRAAVLADRRGFRMVRAQIAEPRPVDPDRHDCARPLPPLGSDGDTRPLFNRIDRWGRPELGTRLSTKSVTAIVATRLVSGAPMRSDIDPASFAPREPEAEPEMPVYEERVAEYSSAAHHRGMASRQDAVRKMADVADLLDRLEAEMDAALAKSKELLG